jgi:hypothetical protein
MVTGTVSHGTSVGVPSLNGTRVSATSGQAGNVYRVAFCENVAFDFGADLEAFRVVKSEFFQISGGFNVSRFVVTCKGLGYFVFDSFCVARQRFECYLYCTVTVFFYGLLLHNRAWTGFHDRYGNTSSIRCEYLAHSKF